MEIKDENFSVVYDASTTTITFEGSLRLYGASGYGEISNLLNNLADEEPPTITINLGELKFLNSSGINTLSKFVIKVRNKKNSQLNVLGSSKHPWQMKSLKNLQKLMPGLVLEIE